MGIIAIKGNRLWYPKESSHTYNKTKTKKWYLILKAFQLYQARAISYPPRIQHFSKNCTSNTEFNMLGAGIKLKFRGTKKLGKSIKVTSFSRA